MNETSGTTAAVDVLVTGGTGLVGNNVIRMRPEAGRTVRAVVRGRTGLQGKAVEGLAIERATGDVTDDDQLNDMGDGALGVVTSHHYSAAHPSSLNKKFVDAFEKANKGLRPNFMAVGGYDGMRVIYEALKTTKGAGGGDALLAAMKGQVFESPRGPVFIDAQTRDIVQNVYLRKVERVNGQLYNVEFEVLKSVKDPGRR